MGRYHKKSFQELQKMYLLPWTTPQTRVKLMKTRFRKTGGLDSALILAG